MKFKRGTLEHFIYRGNLIHPGLYDYSHFKYVDYYTPSWIICKRCGCAFLQSPHHHLTKKRGCEFCNRKEVALKRRKTNEQFKEEINKLYNGFYILDKIDYKGTHSYITPICPIHGEFRIRANDFLNGHGCSKCNQSHLEREIESLLIKNKINYLYNIGKSKFDWLNKFSLDFYLTDYNLAIECQGEQHFRPIKHFGGDKQFEIIKERDIRKFNLCQNNGVKIIYYSNIIIDDYFQPVLNNKEELINLILEAYG